MTRTYPSTCPKCHFRLQRMPFVTCTNTRCQNFVREQNLDMASTHKNSLLDWLFGIAIALMVFFQTIQSLQMLSLSNTVRELRAEIVLLHAADEQTTDAIAEVIKYRSAEAK